MIKKWEPTDSTSIVLVTYNEKRSKLVVKFKSGQVYAYAGVPDNVFEEIQWADSAGKYFNTNIRNVYEATKIED